MPKSVKSASAKGKAKAKPAAAPKKTGAKAAAKAPVAAKKPAAKAVGKAKPEKAQPAKISPEPKAANAEKAVAEKPSLVKVAKSAIKEVVQTVVETVAPASKAATPVPSVMTKSAEKAKVPAEVSPPEKKGKKSKSLTISLDKNADLGEQWKSLYERSKGIDAAPYKMTDAFEARTPIMHKVLGWGYVLSNQNDRLEVLFKDGIKILISNYKG